MSKQSDSRFVVPDRDENRTARETVLHIADTDIEVGQDDPLWGLDEQSDWRMARSEQVICSRGNWIASDELTIEEAADKYQFEYNGFEAEPPDKVCTYCWKKARNEVETEENSPTEIGNVGYRLRWKQRYRAREEWRDIVIRPTATMKDLDALVKGFSTLGRFHLRLYGLEGEYENSSLGILPDEQFEEASLSTQTKASEMTLGDVAEKGDLWEGDKLTMAYDLATPSHYYGLVKDVLTPGKIDALFESMENVEQEAPAAIVKEKDPEDGSITTVSAWPPGQLQAQKENSETDDKDAQDSNPESEQDEPKERVYGVGSGKSDADRDPIEEWSIRDKQEK